MEKSWAGKCDNMGLRLKAAENHAKDSPCLGIDLEVVNEMIWTLPLGKVLMGVSVSLELVCTCISLNLRLEVLCSLYFKIGDVHVKYWALFVTLFTWLYHTKSGKYSEIQ